MNPYEEYEADANSLYHCNSMPVLQNDFYKCTVMIRHMSAYRFFYVNFFYNYYNVSHIGSLVDILLGCFTRSSYCKSRGQIIGDACANFSLAVRHTCAN